MLLVDSGFTCFTCALTILLNFRLTADYAFKSNFISTREDFPEFLKAMTANDEPVMQNVNVPLDNLPLGERQDENIRYRSNVIEVFF